MEKAAREKSRKAFLEFFGETNRGRTARLGVFEGEPGAMTDYWIESNLPLIGIDFDDGAG